MKITLPKLLICLLLAIAFTACSKDLSSDPVNSSPALVKSARVPCGPGCSAEAWLLSVDESTVYEPVNLPAAFKIHNFAVSVMMREQPARGITGNPAVELLRINPR